MDSHAAVLSLSVRLQSLFSRHWMPSSPVGVGTVLLREVENNTALMVSAETRKISRIKVFCVIMFWFLVHRPTGRTGWL